MARTDARRLRLLAALTLALTPVALLRPELTFVPEVWLKVVVACVWRPQAIVSRLTVGATARPVPGRQEDLALQRKLDDLLSAELDPAGDFAGLRPVHARVLRAWGRGAGRRPDHLELAVELARPDLERLVGAPVVYGRDLVGFVAAPAEPGPRHQRLQVELVNHRPAVRSGRQVRRWITLAGSPTAAARLQALVEPSAGDREYPLRILKAAPRQLDTWSTGARTHLVELVASSVLHPQLPRGLVLGWLVDFGYPQEGLVLERFVETRWHPRSLVRVAILVDSDEERKLGPAFTSGLRAPSMRAATGVWSSPRGFTYRFHMIAGEGLPAGAAVVRGQRCLGRVDWAAEGLGMASPLGARGMVLSALWIDRERRRVRALLLVGRGLIAGGACFAIVRPRDIQPAELVGGHLLTGVMGAYFPPGLLVGEVVGIDGATGIRTRLFGADDWPQALAWPEPAP